MSVISLNLSGELGRDSEILLTLELPLKKIHWQSLTNHFLFFSLKENCVARKININNPLTYWQALYIFCPTEIDF